MELAPSKSTLLIVMPSGPAGIKAKSSLKGSESCNVLRNTMLRISIATGDAATHLIKMIIYLAS